MSKTIGPYRFNPRGGYNPSADPLYSLLDLVSDGGGSFVYINDTPSNEPTSSTPHWQQIAEKGDPGGPPGPQGPKGDPGTNPNILHTWDFRNPVNQRGVGTGYVPSYQYTLDRWLASPNVWIAIGSTVNLPVYDGAAKFIDQYIEWDLRGKTYTLSVELENYGYKSATLNYPANGDIAQEVFDELVLSLVRIGSYDTVRIVNWNAQVEYQIKRVKLELGTVSTLHLDPPMDHAVELPKCQRYFQVRSTNNVSAVDLRPSMRITPTVTGSGPYYYSADL